MPAPLLTKPAVPARTALIVPPWMPKFPPSLLKVPALIVPPLIVTLPERAIVLSCKLTVPPEMVRSPEAAPKACALTTKRVLASYQPGVAEMVVAPVKELEELSDPPPVTLSPPVPEMDALIKPPPNCKAPPLLTTDPGLLTSPLSKRASCPIIVMVPVRVCWLRRSKTALLMVTVPAASPKVPLPRTKRVPASTVVPPV